MPPVPAADINQFLQRKQPGWRRLEALLQRVESSGLLSLAGPEIREFGVLYRRASSDLVAARARTANAEVLEYLNDLVARAYAQVYGTRRFRARDLWAYLAAGFPRLFRRWLAYSALAAALTLGAALFGYLAQRSDPSAAYYMLPAEMAQVLPAARERAATRPGHMIGPHEMVMVSTAIFTNNIGVAFLAFALGITFAVGTVVVLLFNGFVLGIFAAAVGSGRAAIGFWSLILPHGIIELTAIFIAGGAGLMLGGALLVPGERSRRDALLERGRVAVLLLVGTLPLFIVAGLIEGFVTPPAWIAPYVKLLFAGFTLVALVAYLGMGGRRGGEGVEVAGTAESLYTRS